MRRTTAFVEAYHRLTRMLTARDRAHPSRARLIRIDLWDTPHARHGFRSFSARRRRTASCAYRHLPASTKRLDRRAMISAKEQRKPLQIRKRDGRNLAVPK